ncbi:MAG: hypothetical protein R2827_05590 [Bdellovibrionales bacterium]
MMLNALGREYCKSKFITEIVKTDERTEKVLSMAVEYDLLVIGAQKTLSLGKLLWNRNG